MTISLQSTLETQPQTQRTRTRHLRGLAHQVHYDLLSLVRNRTAQGFAFAMPIAFLVLFVAMFGNGILRFDGVAVRGSTYYVASLSVFGVVDVAFMALLISLVDMRETGVLRRRRATPQPAWSIIAGRAIVAVLTGIIAAGVLLLVGRIVYGAAVPVDALGPLALTIVLGAFVFACLGFGLACFVYSFQSAQPVAMAAALPLMFISGVFIPWMLVPPWLQHVSAVFPVRALAVMVFDPYLAHGGRSPWDPAGVAELLAWGLVGAVVAVRRFRWAPQDV